MDIRKIFATRKRLKHALIAAAAAFLAIAVLFLGKNRGGEINIIWVPALIAMVICTAGAVTLELMQREMKKDGSDAQKMRDCIYRRLRKNFESGDAKMNVGLTLTILDYYCTDEAKEKIMELARRATTKEEDVLIACGDRILRIVIEDFENRPGGSGRELLSPAERAMYDKLRRAVTGVVDKHAGF